MIKRHFAGGKASDRLLADFSILPTALQIGVVNMSDSYEYLTCPNPACRKKLRLPRTPTYKKVRCPACKESFGFKTGVGIVLDADFKIWESGPPAAFRWARHQIPWMAPLGLLLLGGAIVIFRDLPSDGHATRGETSIIPSKEVVGPDVGRSSSSFISPQTDLPVPGPHEEAKPMSVISRPATGHKIGKWSGASGPCELRVKNGLDEDAAVALKLTGEARAYRYFYVRAHDDFTLRKVKAGTYDLFFQSGSDWAESETTFTRNAALSCFEDQMKFKVVGNSRGIRYSVIEVSLNPVFDGNARTHSVLGSEFPKPDR